MGANELAIRTATEQDIAQLVAIDTLIWHNMAVTENRLLPRITAYPCGQIVAADENGTIYGFMNSQRIIGDDSFEIYKSGMGTWPYMTNNGSMAHIPNGDVLFLITLSVIPDIRNTTGYGRADIADMLLDYMNSLAIDEGLKRLEGITRVNGFAKYLKKLHDYDNLPDDGRKALEREVIRTYIEKVANRDITDPSLTFHTTRGGIVVCPVENAMPGDHDSLCWGAFFYKPVAKR